MIRLVLGHDLSLVVKPVVEEVATSTASDGREVTGYLLLATTIDPDKVLGTMGETSRNGPSDGMLVVACEQAVRHFPMHARVTPPEEDKYKQPHTFDRDRSRSGFFCKCGQDANTAIHGRA